MGNSPHDRSRIKEQEHMTLERALEILESGLITEQEQIEIAQLIREQNETIRTLQS